MLRRPAVVLPVLVAVPAHADFGDDLAASLGVTRPTLREALKKLDRDGFVTVRHGLPTRVNDLWTEGGLNVLAGLAEHGEIVVKPLHGMGGRSIFRSRRGDPNLNVILETLTEGGGRLALAQRFLPEIAQGDPRAGGVEPARVRRHGEDARDRLGQGNAGQHHRDCRRCGYVTIGRPTVEGEDTCQDRETKEHEGEPQLLEFQRLSVEI